MHEAFLPLEPRQGLDVFADEKRQKSIAVTGQAPPPLYEFPLRRQMRPQLTHQSVASLDFIRADKDHAGTRVVVVGFACAGHS